MTSNNSSIHRKTDRLHISWLICTVILLISLIAGCSSQDTGPLNQQEPTERGLPQKIQKLGNVSVYSGNSQAADTVVLKREQIFETNKEVLIKGHIGDIAVDNEDHVYIVGSKPGIGGVYVFDSNGDYITKFGREGRGPGEFLSVSSIKTLGDHLFLFDPQQKKISVYSTNDYTHIRDLVIRRKKVKADTALAPLTPTYFSAIEDGSFLIGFQSNSLSYPNKFRSILYYRLSEDGVVMPGKLLELRRYRFYVSKDYTHSKPFIPLPQPMPFSRSSLTAITKRGYFYTAWTDNFLIKVYDKRGVYQRSIYYSYTNSELNMSQAELSKYQMELIEDNEDKLPATWPALHAMKVDDQKRLWVFTVTDSDSTFKGWVLSRKGKLLARFDWLGQRPARNVMTDPLIVIKNGYLYTWERNVDKRIDRIVKYKINLREP